MTPNLTKKNGKPALSKILRDAGIWILMTLVILGVKVAFEYTETGEDLKSYTHKLLQRRLLSYRSIDSAAVAIVDISDLEPTDLKVGEETYRATPRIELFKLVEAVARHNPLAIGVDIDFSPPESGGYVTPFDPKFFQDCLDLSARTKIPILLGIKRSEVYSPDQWLGVPAYRPLAASVFLPQEDTRKLWRWIQPQKDGPQIQTMAAALAKSLSAPEKQVPQRLEWAIRQFAIKNLGPDYAAEEYIVDYSPLDILELTRLRTKEPAGIDAQAHLIENKIVLIGRATLGMATDTFPVLVRQAPVPGVYLHACGVYTLASSGLYELTGRGRLVLDLLLSLIILAAITAIRVYFSSAENEVDTHWLQGVFTILVIAGAWIVGFVFVHQTRVLWDDFPLVTVGLLMHPRIEKWIANIGSFIKREIGPAIARRIFKGKQDVTNE